MSSLDATRDLSDRLQRALMRLEARCRDKAYCWCGNADLAADLGKGSRSVQLILQELERRGVIWRVLSEAARGESRGKKIREGIILLRRLDPDLPVADPDQIPETVRLMRESIRARFGPPDADPGAQLLALSRAQKPALRRAQEIAPEQRRPRNQDAPNNDGGGPGESLSCSENPGRKAPDAASDGPWPPETLAELARRAAALFPRRPAPDTGLVALAAEFTPAEVETALAIAEHKKAQKKDPPREWSFLLGTLRNGRKGGGLETPPQPKPAESVDDRIAAEKARRERERAAAESKLPTVSVADLEKMATSRARGRTGEAFRRSGVEGLRELAAAGDDQAVAALARVEAAAAPGA